MKKTLVVAMTKDRIIWKWTQLPWDIPEEMKDFRSFTLGKTIVMGSKTYEWIGRALPKRRNIMMARDPMEVNMPNMEITQEDGRWICKGVKNSIEIATSKEELDELTTWEDEILILGGGQIYALFLGDPDTQLRISQLHDQYKGDVYFPEYDHLYSEYQREGKEGFDVVMYWLK